MQLIIYGFNSIKLIEDFQEQVKDANNEFIKNVFLFHIDNGVEGGMHYDAYYGIQCHLDQDTGLVIPPPQKEFDFLNDLCLLWSVDDKCVYQSVSMQSNLSWYYENAFDVELLPMHRLSYEFKLKYGINSMYEDDDSADDSADESADKSV